MNRLRSALFACAAAALPLAAAAQAAVATTRDYARIEPTWEPSFRAETINDSFAGLSAGDWDDLRSFGLYAGASARGWVMESSIFGLTNRADSPEAAGRVDTATFYAGRAFGPLRKKGLEISLDAGAGVSLAGDFGQRYLQERFHALYGNKRPVPARYDAVAAPASAFAAAGLSVRAGSEVLPLAFGAGLRLGADDYARADAFASLSPLAGFLGATASVGAQWTDAYGAASPALARTLESERGLYGAAAFRIGWLEYGFVHNLGASRQGGYIALRTPPAPDGHGGRSRAAAGNAGAGKGTSPAEKSLEFRLNPIRPSVRYRFALAEGPVVLSPLAGADSGSVKAPGTDGSETRIRLFQQVYAGFDVSLPGYSWPAASWFRPYALAAAGVRCEQRRTRLATASRILAEDFGPVGVLEAGVRVFGPWQDEGGERLGLGISYGAAYSGALEPGWHGEFSLRLVGTTGRRQP